MNSVLSYAFAVYFFVSGSILFCMAVVLALLTAPFDPQRRLVHRFCSVCARHYMDLMPGWNCSYQGLENIPRDRPCVFVSNHQSIADIIVLYGLLAPFKFVAKRSLARAPLIGWVIWLNQYVTTTRSLASIKQMLRTCRRWLRCGMPILMFPEGTRSADGHIQRFMPGAFKLAVDCDVPVVPIVLDGTGKVIPKGARQLSFRQPMQVRVLPALQPADFCKDARKLRNYTRDLMRRNLAQMRAQQALATQQLSLPATMSKPLPPGAAV